MNNVSTEEPKEVISVRHLWAGYNDRAVLEDINLSVKERDFIGLIGLNGGGKTTLLRVLLGLLPPTKGQVRIMGQPVEKGRQYVGYVPQSVETADLHRPRVGIGAGDTDLGRAYGQRRSAGHGQRL